jgi:hypothetical protein
MLRLLTKFFSLMMLFVSGASHAQFYFPTWMISQRCLPAYENYFNCQQLDPSRRAGNDYCINANSAWVSSGCAAETQAKFLLLNRCAQVMGMSPEEMNPSLLQQVCPKIPFQ